jgi:hypothetical protein
VIVGELIDALAQFPRTKEVKVRHGRDLPGPNHYTIGVEENGTGDAVLRITWLTDDPDDHGRPEAEELAE